MQTRLEDMDYKEEDVILEDGIERFMRRKHDSSNKS